MLSKSASVPSGFELLAPICVDVTNPDDVGLDAQSVPGFTASAAHVVLPGYAGARSAPNTTASKRTIGKKSTRKARRDAAPRDEDPRIPTKDTRAGRTSKNNRHGDLCRLLQTLVLPRERTSFRGLRADAIHARRASLRRRERAVRRFAATAASAASNPSARPSFDGADGTRQPQLPRSSPLMSGGLCAPAS